jgi:hypothetical protein
VRPRKSRVAALIDINLDFSDTVPRPPVGGEARQENQDQLGDEDQPGRRCQHSADSSGQDFGSGDAKGYQTYG